MPVENQVTITQWADRTFGETSTVNSTIRVQKELTKLFQAIADGNHDKACEECADVYITLCRVASCLGCDLDLRTDIKMQINRNRKWIKDGRGCAQHVPDGRDRG